MKHEIILDSSAKEVLQNEIDRLNYRQRFLDALSTTIVSLVTVMAFVLLAGTLFFPVLSVYGNSMDPAIKEDSYVVATKTGAPKRGAVLAYYCNDKIVIRRVIGLPGDTISIDQSGIVSVNGETLEEKYVTRHTLGACDIEFPFTVPEGEYFMLADNRAGGADSRESIVGCAVEEEFIGVARLVIWPIYKIGIVK